MVYGRSLLASFPDVVKSTRTGNRSEYDRDAFMSKLGEILARAHWAYDTEKKLFGGLGGINIFGCSDFPSVNGRILLFGMNRDNRAKSTGLPSTLQKQGKLVGYMRSNTN